jgi:hypothetical protein
MSRGDELVEALRTGSAADPDAAATELLDEFFGGYPVQRLADLLRADHDAAVRAGAWIASELGDRAAPVLDEVAPLLDSPIRYARFFAIDAVLVTATPAHGRLLAAAVQRVTDADDAVRWKATHLLAHASTPQLTAAVPYLRDERLRVLTTWLLGDIAAADVTARLGADDRDDRLFAVASAVRSFDRDPAPLEAAASSADTEISSFAQRERENLGQRRRR